MDKFAGIKFYLNPDETISRSCCVFRKNWFSRKSRDFKKKDVSGINHVIYPKNDQQARQHEVTVEQQGGQEYEPVV